jgi:hypothetical protein
MQKLAPKVKDGWTRIAGKPERAWLGFGLKNLDDLKLDILPQLPQLQQQSILGNYCGENNVEGINGVASVASVANSEKSVLGDKKRFCADECDNFGDRKCTAPNPIGRSKDAEIPLRCPGYEQAQAGEGA